MSALMSVLSSAGSSSRDAARSSWSPSTFSRFCRTTTGMRTALQIANCNSDSSYDAILFFSTRHPFDTPHTPLRLQAHIDTRSCATPTMNSGSATSAHTHHETFHAKSTSLVTTRRSSAVIVGKSSSPRWSPCTTPSG